MGELVIALLTFLRKVVEILMGLSVNKYDATLTIDGFRGLMQFDENESVNTDMRYAVDGKNFDTRDGNLQPKALPVAAVPSDTFSPEIEGSGLLRKSTIDGTGFYGNKNYLFILGKKINNAYLVRFIAPGCESSWASDMLEGTIDGLNGSFVQYEHIYTPAGSASTKVDAIYHSDASNGMRGWAILSNAVLTIGVTTPYNIGIITRYGERIWGADITGEPDLVVYSAPYDPEDWSINQQIPEDGAGEVRIPSFDGDRITAMIPFSNSLLIFKEHHIWRLTGLSPDEYQFQEQFGGGTIYPNTVVIYNEAVYFLTDDGVCVYDGLSVKPFQQYALRTLWRDMPIRNLNLRAPVGVVWKNKYILSFPGKSTDTKNTQTVVYDFENGSWSVAGVEFSANAYHVVDNDLYMIVVMPPNTFGQGLSALKQWYGAIDETPASVQNTVTSFEGFDWVSPWSDLGVKDVLKTDFKLRFWIQTHVNLTGASPITENEKLKLSITLETERGSKTRELIFDSNVDEEIKMNFHLTGRKVRMMISVRNAEDEVTMPCWCKIMGGMQLIADVAKD